MKRNKSEYAIARGPYKEMFPNARMHHMVPTSRHGADSEFNLFPWNEAAHSAWHRLFCIMTVREVWPLLADVHLQLFENSSHHIVRDWCIHPLAHCKASEHIDVHTPQDIEILRACWVTCFGDTSLKNAQRLVRYMMLFMVFGRHADSSAHVYQAVFLVKISHEVDHDAERAWAFRQLFRVVPSRAYPRLLRGTIRNVRKSVASIPIH